MNKPWSYLPNAHYIDWVIESFRQNPRLWTEAWDVARCSARDAAWYTAGEAAVQAARDAVWNTAWYTVGNAAWDPKRNAAKNAARDAVAAFIAYDDCDRYLSMSYEKLQIWAALSEHPAAVLLQPMAYVKERTQTLSH